MHRYIPVTETDKATMLDRIGKSSIDELFVAIPESIRLQTDLNIPEGISEPELIKIMKVCADENISTEDLCCFLGAGCYDHYIPATIKHLVSRSEFLTAYTPYQPEISQGTLQAIFEYQSNICNLTGLAYSNASLYDVATATGEAAFIAADATRRKKILVSRAVDPQIRAVLRTMLVNASIETEEIALIDFATDGLNCSAKSNDGVAAIIVQSPNFFGTIEEMKAFSEIAKANKALFIAIVDPISLAILPTPAEYGADIAVGNAQPLGNPMNFGGPHIGFIAVTEKHLRRLPGRIVGQTVDREGRRCYVLTLQAREQHIRREKATSNICSNQALCALTATIYLSLVGADGLQEVARQCTNKSYYAREQLLATESFNAVRQPVFFREFVLAAKSGATKVNELLMNCGILGGYDLSADYPEYRDHLLFCVTEKRSKQEIDRLCQVLS
ncbi:MAG: aminomethyl-transferring glycine dehydrogenase subunit GcvPA [Negativicutes bacterium]|jgi:glycine dehydrogenase subunit 1